MTTSVHITTDEKWKSVLSTTKPIEKPTEETSYIIHTSNDENDEIESDNETTEDTETNIQFLIDIDNPDYNYEPQPISLSESDKELAARVIMTDFPRYTVTYCQYGDTRMKPTDIWTNHPNPKFKPCCHNGDSCHIPAPRGSKTGTQGLKGSIERAIIPEQLCEHIVDICEEYCD